MQTQQRQYVYWAASAATVLLAIIGALYLAGAVITSRVHDKRAMACFGLALVASVVVFLMRPPIQVAA